jgi:tetratricopeptide (TPR) repeat protein
VNRSHELTTISDKVEATGGARATVIVLSGLGGVGKTAAVLRWAHRHLDHFTEGQLYVDLKEYRRSGGVELSEVLSGFLRVLGVREDYVPASFPERAAMFRSRTMTKRLLVVVENADQAAQIRPLIPGSAGSVVLVTSRRKLGGLITEGAEFIDVAPLSVPDSEALLTQMLRDHLEPSPRGVTDLAELCGGLPLALCVAGAQLAQRKRWSVPHLVRYLTDDRQRLARLSYDGEDGVRLMFDAAYCELPDAAKRMYRLLGLHPGSRFALEAAAAVAAVTATYADELIGVLLASNLLEELGDDRYRFHDLVHLHARAMADQEETAPARDEAMKRLINWYARAAALADRAVMGEARWREGTHVPEPGDTTFDSPSAMSWFSAEQSNLLAIVNESWHQELFTTVWTLCESLWAFYFNMKIYSDWLETHRLGIAATVRCGNEVAQARMRNQLARAYIELHDFESAEEELARGIEAAGDDMRCRAVVLESRGLLYRELKRYGESEENLRQARELNRRLGSDRGVAIQSYQLGDVLVRAGRVDDGLRALAEAMEIAEEIHDDLSAAKARIALGNAYHHMDRLTEARSVLTSAVRTTRDRQQPVKEAQALEILVKVAQRDNDRVLLHDSAARLVQLYEAAGSPLVAAAKGLLAGENT